MGQTEKVRLMANKSWSYSKLSLYEKCPAQYNFRYVENFPTEKSTAASRGTEIHASIEDYLLGKSEKLHESVEHKRPFFDKLALKEPLIEEKLAIDNKWNPAQWETAWGRMVVDSYYTTRNKVVVQEWKSGKQYDDHTEQRKLYGVTLLGKYADRSAAVIRTIYTDLNKNVREVVTRDDMAPIQEDFTRRVRFMHRDDLMSPRPGWYCRFCPFSRVKDGPCRVG